MKSKSCTLIPIDRARITRQWLKCLPLAVSLVMMLSSQGSAQSPSPSPAKKPMGYLRFWNLILKSSATFDLTVGSTGAQDPAFLVASPLNFYGSYRPLPPGSYQIKIYKAGDRNSVLKEFSLPMRDGTCLTILAQEKEGRVSIEANDDTFDPMKTDTARLTIRDFYPDAKVVVTVDNNQKSQPLSIGEVSQLDLLPLKTVSLAMVATGTGGQVSQWTTAVDFSTARRATLLVVPDAYGRFRPRVAIDGQPPKLEDEAQNDASARPRR